MTPLPAPPFLLPSELTQMSVDAAALLADPQITVPVTYKDLLSEAFVPATGVKTRTYVDYACRALRNAVPAREVAGAPGLYETGDLRFTVLRVALGGNTPSRDDLLVDGALTYDIVSWDSDPVSLLWRIVARLTS